MPDDHEMEFAKRDEAAEFWFRCAVLGVLALACVAGFWLAGDWIGRAIAADRTDEVDEGRVTRGGGNAP